MRQQQLKDFGPYRIVRPIARGGMAEIYLARQRGFEGVERTVVIKRILERHADDEEFITMFLDEARLMAALSHPNIAQVFDLGRIGETYYLSMEYVRGPVLGELLAAAKRGPEGRLPRPDALAIALEIAEALHYVHERRDELGRPLNIVHRDLNPANVIVSYDGAVKLIDFGIAKTAMKVYETRAGVIKGTYGYIAPEQLAGTTPVDRRADVFALGILLYEMCVGVHPFDLSDEPNLIDRILEARYRRPRAVLPDLPRSLDRLIGSCLAPHPEGRPEHVGELIDALAAELAAQGEVPTMTRLARLARELVPDSEGPRPLKPLTAVGRPRPLDPDPGGTRRLSVDTKEARPGGTRATSLPLAPRSGAADEDGEDIWTEETAPFADEGPVTMAGPQSFDLDVPTVTLLHPSGPAADPGDDDEITDSNLDLLTVPAPEADLQDDEEAPTRMMPSAEPRRAPAAGASAPSLAQEATYVPGSAPRRRGDLRPLWVLAAGGGIALMIGAAALGLVQLFGAPEPAASLQAAPSEPAAEERDPVPIELHVSSEPAGARVQVDGRQISGRTPLTVVLPPQTGPVWLRLSKEGFVDQERQVSATVGEARFVLSRLEDRAASAPARGGGGGG